MTQFVLADVCAKKKPKKENTKNNKKGKPTRRYKELKAFNYQLEALKRRL